MHFHKKSASTMPRHTCTVYTAESRTTHAYNITALDDIGGHESQTCCTTEHAFNLAANA